MGPDGPGRTRARQGRPLAEPTRPHIPIAPTIITRRRKKRRRAIGTATTNMPRITWLIITSYAMGSGLRTAIGQPYACPPRMAVILPQCGGFAAPLRAACRCARTLVRRGRQPVSRTTHPKAPEFHCPPRVSNRYCIPPVYFLRPHDHIEIEAGLRLNDRTTHVAVTPPVQWIASPHIAKRYPTAMR